MSESAKNKGRLAIYSMAGVFILFESWNLKNALETETENRMLLMVFMILFAVVGVAMVIGGTYGGYRLMKKEREEAGSSLPEASEAAEKESAEESGTTGDTARTETADSREEMEK